MTIGTDLCQSYESYATAQPDGSCKAYWDRIGKVWTLGWGSTGPAIGSFTQWSRSQADDWFEKVWSNTRTGVLRASPFLSAPEHYNRLEALTCFAYNCGTGAYQTSTLRRKVNAFDWIGAAAEFGKWNHSKGKVVAGLTRRRASERALFELPVSTSQPLTSDANLSIVAPLPALHPEQNASASVAIQKAPIAETISPSQSSANAVLGQLRQLEDVIRLYLRH